MSENLTEKQQMAYAKIKAGENLCIFGKGGSGKSHLIELIIDEKTLLLAPTGMAALNLGGSARTMHSVLMIGEKSLNAWSWEKVKFSIESKEIVLKKFFDKYERIVFDEGSMIISGLFNTFVQLFHTIYGTDSQKLFNGRQIIITFDPLQLPPIKNEDTFLDLNKAKRPQPLSKTDYIVTNPDFKALFNERLGNIVHFTENMRNRDPEWNEVLDACRTGFLFCNPTDKERLLILLNERVFTRNDIWNDALLKELYDNNTVTSFRRTFIEEVNNKRFIKLIENNHGITHQIDRNVMISKRDFISEYIDRYDNPGRIYELSKNYQDNLGGYYSHKKKVQNKDIIETKFSITVGQRVMLRYNQLHPKLINGSLGNIVSIELDENQEVTSIKVKFDTLEDSINVKRIEFKHQDISKMCISAFPLIPSSAITLHKLQGQTWDSKLFIHYCDIPYVEKQDHLLYTGISRNKNKEDIYIISDIDLDETYFPVNKIMFDWYCAHR
tara:strand:- start:1904 stop:3394 length:1491 start_codon:yes stop_codon:yes gene_type:complete